MSNPFLIPTNPYAVSGGTILVLDDGDDVMELTWSAFMEANSDGFTPEDWDCIHHELEFTGIHRGSPAQGLTFTLQVR